MFEVPTLEFEKESVTEYVGLVNAVELAVNVTFVPVTTADPGESDEMVTVGVSANAKTGARKTTASKGPITLLIFKIYNLT